MEDNRPLDFLNYVNKPLNMENISLLLGDNNIIFERSVIYRDFILSLIDLVCETYMGDDITSDDEKINHFDWCWNKTLQNFKEEGIDFSRDDNLYEYFLNFMLETFYLSRKKSEKLHLNLLMLWSYIFGYTTPKSRSDIDSFIEVYKLFDKSLIKLQKK